jgi:hypothetical protein
MKVLIWPQQQVVLVQLPRAHFRWVAPTSASRHQEETYLNYHGGIYKFYFPVEQLLFILSQHVLQLT